MLLSGWFGWSVLWIFPLLWRLCRVWVVKTASLRGQGSIRLWLGTVLTLSSGSALEALASDPAPAFGAAVSAILASVFGSALAALILLLIFAFALPWLFGASLPGVLRRRASAEVRRIPAAAETTVSAPQHLPRARGAGGSARRLESWRLPAPLAERRHKDRFASPLPKNPAAGSPEPRKEWAPFESIRPTSAMLARERERAVQAPQTPEPPPAFARYIPGKKPASTKPAGVPETPPTQTLPQPQHDFPAAASIAPPRPARLPEAVQAEPMPAPVADTRESAPVRLAVALPAAIDLTHDAGFVPAADEAPSNPVTRDEDPVFVEPARFVAPREPEPAMPAHAPAAAAALNAPPPAFAKKEPMPAPGISGPHAPPAQAVDLPGLDLLDRARGNAIEIPAEELAETGQLIEQRLKEFKVPVTVLGACAGPVITRFEVEPAIGVRGAQIVGLMKDLSRALGLTSIRVVETIPGKTCMGLELPNARRQTIRLSEMLESDAYHGSASRLTLAMGKDITGAPVTTDLARAPHMLVAGTTGSGKSVAINAMILSLLYKATPAEVRLIMIDPKMLELSVYDGIPHLLAPVVTDMKLAANALNWCVGEMEKRYRLMSALGVRNLAGYNQKIRDAQARESKVPNPFSLTPDAPEPLSTLPLIVVVIDELADLMMVAGKKIEELIARLAQKARAAGIHLILATQRPSVDVITGLIKANIPTRVAFQVSSKIDSRTVLDQMGAESLLGHGDMLFLPPGSGYPQRVHGAFVSDEEVHRVVEFLKQFGEPEYEEAILAGPAADDPQPELFGEDGSSESDPLYDEAVAFVVRSRRASISAVQRQLRIGYNRAARLVEQMESAGILSSMAANGSREILVPPSAD